MKRLIAFILPLLLAACASTPPATFSVNDLGKSQVVTLQDIHPAEEDKREVFSYLVTSERYGIFRMGSVSSEPSAMRLLQHRVYEHFGGVPVNVKVYHFVIYQNVQGTLRAGAVGSVFGAVGALIASSTVNDDVGSFASIADPTFFAETEGDAEWERGVSTSEENPDNGATLITWIDVEINGKRVLVRGVSPMKVPDGRVPYVVAIESAYDYLLKQF